MAERHEKGSQKTAVVIGAHPDDSEVAAAGLMYKLARNDEYYLVSVICTDGEKSNGNADIHYRIDEAKRAADMMGVDEIHFLHFPDTKLHGVACELKDEIDKIITEKNPYMLITHSKDDKHQDHRTVAKVLSISAKRVPNLFRYNSPSISTQFTPNFFVSLTQNELEEKIHLLEECFRTQVDKPYGLDMDEIRQESILYAKKYCRVNGGNPGTLIYACEPLYAERIIQNWMEWLK